MEESQPSGLSGPYAHAPCWLKVSLSLKLRCRAPQLPPAVLSGPKIDLFVSKCVKLAKNVYFVCEMCHFVNSPPGAGCERTPFAIKGTLTLGDTYPQKHTVKQSVASSNIEKYSPEVR